MNSKRKVIWVSIFSSLVIISILVTLIARIPSASQQLPPNNAPLLVTLSHPTDGSTWPADTPIPMAVMVTAGSPIKSVEFWTDGHLFETKTPVSGRESFYTISSWMPLTQGAHAVFVRATDEGGRTADSNAVHITATEPAGFLAVMTTQGGETLQSLAEENGATVEQISNANSSLDPVGPIEPGTQVFLPVQSVSIPSFGEPPVSTLPDGPVEPAQEGGPSGPSFYLAGAINIYRNAPVAPILSASAKDCEIILNIEDKSNNEAGFFVYSLPETSTSFERITSLRAHSGAGVLQYALKDQSGYVQFYVSSYNTAGESSSSPEAVTLTNPQCKTIQGKSGVIKYENGYLSIPSNVQLAYLYGSINGSEWQRFPEEHEFLDPSPDPIDLRTTIREVLGEGTSGGADIDVWGWSGGALVHIGQQHINLNFTSLSICNLSAGCSGDMGATHWVNEAVVGSDKAASTRNLQWKAAGSDITHAVWQLSTQPFPAEYSVGAPPGLLISGISEATVNKTTGTAAGKFTIDFKTDIESILKDNQESKPKRASGFPGNFGSFNQELFSMLADGWINPYGLIGYQNWLAQKYYIRVVPYSGGHPASDPSNNVVVTYEPTGDPPPIHISAIPTYTVEIVPDSYVNEVQAVPIVGIMGCSDIIDVDHDKVFNPYMQSYAALLPKGFSFDMAMFEPAAEAGAQFWISHIGWTACPSFNDDEETIWDYMASGFKSAIDSLSASFEQLKGELVSAIASFIPFCGEGCKTLLMTGLNFAITYFTGLPPSIPTFDGMVNMGLDYAVQMAIAQSGIPYCDEICQEQIAGTVKDIANDVSKSGKDQPACGKNLWATDGTKTHSLKPLCFPPGVITNPVKGSMYEKGMVQVLVTRIDGSPEPAPMQQLYVDTSAKNFLFGDGHSEGFYFDTQSPEKCWNNHCYKDTIHNYYTMVFNAPLEGNPYRPEVITVPPLKTGQSVNIPVVLTSSGGTIEYSPPNVYLPRAIAIQNTYPDMDLNTIPVNWWLDFQHLTDNGAQISITAKLFCQDKAVSWMWTSPCSEVATQQFTVPFFGAK